MKLAEFNYLCLREWGAACGDVISLSLTDESYTELRAEIGFKFLGPSGLVNPVTRSVAKVSDGAGSDTAEVRRHYGSETAPVPAKAELALEAVRSLGAAQRKTADDLRGAITKAREAGVTWQAIAGALGDRYENVLRQYKCGSPIVVVRARQNPQRSADGSG